MSSYTGKHAKYYDIFYQDKDYVAEAEFIGQCIKRFGLSEGRRLLELACGTGNHAFALETLDYQLLATDYSPAESSFQFGLLAHWDGFVELLTVTKRSTTCSKCLLCNEV